MNPIGKNALVTLKDLSFSPVVRGIARMAPRGVERTLSWMSNFRRLKLCYERFGEHFQAFRDLAASLIRANRVQELGLIK